MKRAPYIKLSAVLLLAAVYLFSLGALGHLKAQENRENKGKEEAEEGRKMSREAQEALVEANRRLETKPDDYAAAREPLVNFLAVPQPDPIPVMMYQMLGQLWYADEKNKKHIEEARKVFKAGFEAFPDNGQLLLNYAVTTYELEKFADAAPLFEKYYELDPKHEVKYLEYAAAAYYTAEDLKNAKRVYVRIIGSAEKPETKWLDSIIAICTAQEDNAETEKYIRMALRNYPMEKKYWNLMAQVFYGKEDYKGAASVLEIATRVQAPEKDSEWKTLVDLYNYINLPLRAARGLQQELPLMKKGGTSEEDQQILVAEAYARGMRVDKAVAYLDAILAKNTTFKLLMEKGKVLYNARRNKEAIEVLDQCIAMNPKAYNAYIMKGWALWDMKEWKTAKKAFNGALNSKDYGLQAQDALDMLASLDEAQAK